MTPSIPCKQLLRLPVLSLLLLVLLVSGCNVTKYVPEGDALFVDYSVKVVGEDASTKRDQNLEAELARVVKPEPNTSFLGLYPKLWIYNTFYTEKDKGIKNWIQTKFGEEPVLLSEVDTSALNEIMSNRLHNRGYFNNNIQSNAIVENQKAVINWAAFIGEPYTIRNIEYTLVEPDSLPARRDVPVYRDIQQTREGSLLETGTPYNLRTMIAERARIDSILKSEGYYYFSPDLLIFSVDSLIGDRQVDVLLRIKSSAPRRALHPYKIDDVYIFANYSLGDSLSVADTIDYKGYHYIPNENYVRARHLLRGVFLEQDSLYTRQDVLLTTNRLLGLPAYKYVNVEFERDNLKNHMLDAYIYLTPALKKALRAEIKYVRKTNNFAGPGLSVSFRNRNAFKGSELLTVEGTARFETQVGGRSAGDAPEGVPVAGNNSLNSYELGIQAGITIPRIVSPFNLPNLRTLYVPTTAIAAGFNLLSRVEFFRMNSYNASYGYSWRPKQTLTHEISPINLQYVRLSNVTEAFSEILETQPYLLRSFRNQFIIGPVYELTYTTQVFPERTHQVFNHLTIDVSGNVVSGIQSLLGAAPPTAEEPRTLLGQPYSQYSLFLNDFRYYWNITEESQLVARLVAGAGFTYGNSTVLPYVKQFSIGGPNSIRAFRARSIGPGTYNVPDEYAFAYFDQLGDIKLESNLEYRFPIAGFFKGAVFVDAGNIWLMDEARDNEGQEKPQFDPNTFLSEIAVGTGFGLRVDVDFFVVRFDVGIPVRVPYLPKGDRFVLGDFNGKFNGENGMLLNIAIGYPF
ncbi:outer membrane protein assembly factor BamA [Pontibacter ummariensis]|uniref:Outer membrane protein assembly factor BamA n=1 Tax=Pontibacter ummariensis TaxID=1610492 RepID=A0A239J9D6_9BACT|nr:BamA/TamA family outer membrane protein [Pontibacter ummariensis]PRY08897.1 outer membrane protein assembly factor BamA [Pontibacter ummariensis]SNT01264.1 Outer membrane protein assembly factor BamA [Pontibacter ummariensis]